MAGTIKDLTGLIGNTLQFSNAVGSRISNSGAIIQIKNAADNAFAELQALALQASPDKNAIPVRIDIQAKVIMYSFDGVSPPSPNANLGKFGFCHTTGGDYTQNDIVYDSGTALIKMTRESCWAIYSTDAITGVVSLNADGAFAWEGSAYVLKGDGSSTDTGFVKSIEISYTKDSGNVDSTTSIPNGARVIRVINDVTTAFDGTAPTVAVTVNGSSPLTIMATAQNNQKVINQYEVEDFAAVGATNTGIVRVAVTPDSSTAGVGKVLVLYTSPGA
jgi:hypothetical protein